MKLIGKILLVINIVLFIISFSIAFVILFRPFYYHQIKSLNIEEKSNLSYEEIKEAYDDVLDYTTMKGSFKTGKLKYSSDGMNHFRDCKKLFILDFLILGISTIVLLVQFKYFRKVKILNFSPGFWSSISIIVFFILVLISYLLLGFNKVFELFHKVFFLGKSNWILDPDTDPIIDIFPKEYFLNCAILALSIVGIISFGIIIKEIIKHKKKVI